MAICSTLVQSLQVNTDVLANTMIDTDPVEMGRLPRRPSVSAMQLPGGPTDAVVHDTDEAHTHKRRRWLSSRCASSDSTATPTNLDVHPGTVVHTSPHSDEDFHSW
eukprot:m.258626 g.258626  ORF g.258626 m.258626 type:complete len:106 (-) comp26624_c0_seq10:281-598(-)